MKIWFTHKNLFFILFFLGIHLSNAQVLYNNGATIKVNTGGIVMVKGSAENAAGTYTNNGYTTIDQNITNGDTLQGNGTYEILGHWINNAYLITDLTNSSLVWLNGTASQNIQGTQISLFWNIELSNGLEKIQMINSGSKNSLNLHNQILRADQYSFEVFNTQTNSVLRDAGATYGFVQANLGGKLIRNSALSSTYLFPVGSNVGVLRYRPVELTPTNTLANRYAVRMANVEAGTEGLNRNLHDAEICLLEPDFYHQIQRLTGSTSVLLQAFYEPISDGSWLGLSQWNGAQWNHMASGVHNIGSPFNSVQLANWNNFSTDPYIFDITLPIVSTNPDTTICNGASITLTASGAVSYTWTNNLDATIFSGNPFAVNPTQNTIYVVTGTNGTCSSTDTVHVSINNIAIASVDTTWSDCGASNATATVNASGGDSNYTYLWGTTPAQTTITATGLGVGTVQVTVTDHNGSGCTAIGSATIGESGAPTVSVLSSASQVCPDGSVTLTASGADSYTWSSTNGVFNPISANTNPIVLEQVTQLTQVTVTGTSSGCTDVETIQIDIYPAISTDTPQYVCNGTNTQYQVSFEITGGDPTSYGVLPVGGNIASTAPYIYTSDWIASGQAYSYQVFDIHQCDTLVMAGTHDCSCPVVAQMLNGNDTICSGGSAQIEVQLSGGAFPYSLTYSDGASNQTITGINASPYYITVTPSANTNYSLVSVLDGTCSGAVSGLANVAINNIAVASIDTTWSDCGASNATATVNASGGDSNYTYLWGTTPAQTTITATGLGVGTVQVTVTDHNGSGCTAIGSATIGESGAPTVSVLSSASQVCPDGSVTLTASGADSYTWSSTNGVFNPISANTNPIVLEQVTQLTQVTVTGTSSGCTDVETIQIDIYPAISTDTPQYVCNGTNTQYQVSFEITGGDPTSYGVLPVGGNIASTAPYIYTSDWIASGQAYSYQVFDIHQCDTLVMAGTHDCSCPVVAQMLNGNDTICSGGSAQIEVQLSGGAFPYSLTYSDGASNQTITGINASPYYITVTPSANTNYSLVSVLDGTCSGAVSGHAEVWVNMLHIDNLNVLNEQCGLDNGSAQAIVSSGWGTYTYQWNTTPVQINATASNLSAGSYSVTVTDQNGSGCSVVGSVMVTDQTQIVVSIQSSGTSVCNGGSIQLSAIGAANYTWLPNDGSLDTQTGSSVFASPNQTTNYIVTGTLGTCSGQAQISISVGQTPVIAVGTLDASCGQNDGAAWVSITGTPGGQINWSNAQTNDTIENLAAGNYSVTVTYNGCQSQESVHVNQHGGLNIQITPSASTLCSSGQVSLLASGATNYTWSSTPNIGIDYSNSNPLVVNINQTTVFHVVGESLGCTGERSIEITVVKPPVVKVDPDSICRGDSVLLSIQANTGFRWLNLPNGYDPYQANHMLAPTQTTTYQVQVDNGVCPSAIYSAIVVVHPLPNVQIVASENPIWGGESTVLTAVGAESYQWLPIVSVEYPYAESNLVQPIKNTKYTVVGTDINGCISFDTLTVAVMHNDNFYIPNVFSPNGDGENDKLFVRGTGFNTMYFVVYDRWGEKVFETKDFSQGWDGTYRGQALDPAVFAYFVKAVFWDGTEHSENGSVTLVK